MIVRRVSPLSLAKLMGVVYLAIGLLIGACVSLLSIVGGAFFPSNESSGMTGVLFGAAAIVVLPIFYGVLGFLGSLLMAVVYNAAASVVGGVEIDVQ